MGEFKLLGGNIFITTLSLFHLFSNSQHPEKWSVSFMDFLRSVNASRVVTCRYPQVYWKSALEKLHSLCLLRQVFWKKCFVSCIFETIVECNSMVSAPDYIYLYLYYIYIIFILFFILYIYYIYVYIYFWVILALI